MIGHIVSVREIHVCESDIVIQNASEHHIRRVTATCRKLDGHILELLAQQIARGQDVPNPHRIKRLPNQHIAAAEMCQCAVLITGRNMRAAHKQGRFRQAPLSGVL